VPNDGVFALLRVPLAGFWQVHNSIRTVHQVYFLELEDLPRFRDAIADFFDDIGFLMLAGFQPPTLDNIKNSTVRLTCLRTVSLVAVIDSEGMAIDCEALSVFAKVSRQFRYMCGGDRRMFRRAMQFMIGTADFEMSIIIAACEIINEAQSQHWRWKVKWTEVFDNVMINPDRKIMRFPLPVGVNLIQMEITNVEGKLQITVKCRGVTKTFTILRPVIQLIAECEADCPFIL
jgi:hypothetical protein